MTDIEVLERQIQCVQRKAQINCTNCGSCDLLMDDNRILEAYANAISALRSQQEAVKNRPTLEEIVDLQKRYQKLFEEKRLTKKAICDLGVPFRDKYGLNDYDALRVIRGELSLEEIAIFISSHCSPSKDAENNHPLTLEELRQMDGQPVWVDFIPDPGEERLALWALVSVDEEDGEIFLLNNLGGNSSYEEIWAVIRAIYRYPPGSMAH